MRPLSRALALMILACAGAGSAWASDSSDPAAPPTGSSLVGEEEGMPGTPWSFSLATAIYVVPDARDYIQPTVSVDRGPLHLEARFNYEALTSGSVWVGYTLSAGDAWEISVTPMVGGVMGDVTGIAPGLEGSLVWRGLELYGEVEYVADLNDSSSSFLYLWSELTFAPVDGFRFGLAAQRTKVRAQGMEVDRGLMAGIAFGPTEFTAHFFNLETGSPTFVVGIGVHF